MSIADSIRVSEYEDEDRPSMQRGWFAIDRMIDESELFANAELFRLFSFLALKASHQTTHLSVPTGRGSKTVTLKPGQTFVGRYATSLKLSCDPETFRKRLKRLETMGVIHCEGTSHGTIVTVLKYLVIRDSVNYHGTTQKASSVPPLKQEEYQHKAEIKPSENKDDASRLSSCSTSINDKVVPAEYQASTTKKNEKKEKKDITDGFDDWYQQYPKKVAKSAAQKAYVKAVKRISVSRKLSKCEAVGFLLEKLREFLFSKEKQFQPNPATWLNGERYDDEVETIETSGQKSAKAVFNQIEKDERE